MGTPGAFVLDGDGKRKLCSDGKYATFDASGASACCGFCLTGCADGYKPGNRIIANVSHEYDTGWIAGPLAALTYYTFLLPSPPAVGELYYTQRLLVFRDSRRTVYKWQPSVCLHGICGSYSGVPSLTYYGFAAITVEEYVKRELVYSSEGSDRSFYYEDRFENVDFGYSGPAWSSVTNYTTTTPPDWEGDLPIEVCWKRTTLGAEVGVTWGSLSGFLSHAVAITVGTGTGDFANAKFRSRTSAVSCGDTGPYSNEFASPHPMMPSSFGLGEKSNCAGNHCITVQSTDGKTSVSENGNNFGFHPIRASWVPFAPSYGWLQSAIQAVQAWRAANGSTHPTTLAEPWTTNNYGSNGGLPTYDYSAGPVINAGPLPSFDKFGILHQVWLSPYLSGDYAQRIGCCPAGTYDVPASVQTAYNEETETYEPVPNLISSVTVAAGKCPTCVRGGLKDGTTCPDAIVVRITHSEINGGLPKDIPILRLGTSAAYSGVLDGISVGITYYGPATGEESPWRWELSVYRASPEAYSTFEIANAACECLSSSSSLSLVDHNSSVTPTMEIL